MAILGSSGGGSGDTYTASTAVAKSAITAGKSYNLTADGGIVDPVTVVGNSGGQDPTIFDATSNFENCVSIYGDVITPDGKAWFVAAQDTSSPYQCLLYINKDGDGTRIAGDSSDSYFNQSNGVYSPYESAFYLHNYADDGTCWYYLLTGTKKHSYSSVYFATGCFTFRVNKATHSIDGINYVNPYTRQWWGWSDNHGSRVRKESFYTGNSNNKHWVNSMRGGKHLLYAQGNAYDGDHEYTVYMGNTHAPSAGTESQQYWQSNGSMTITPTEDGHNPFFKVSDANGTFICLYVKDGDTGYSYKHASCPASQSGAMTSSAEIDVTGTLGSNMQYAHFIATSNPLVYYATYLDNSTTMYYQKITFASDLTSASMATMGSFTVPGGYGSYGGGVTRWARYYHLGYGSSGRSYTKLSLPQFEKFLLWGTSSPASDTGRTLLFPAVGTPSDGGANTINTDFQVNGILLTLTLANGGDWIVAHEHNGAEARGYEVVAAAKYGSARTSSAPAIARTTGITGDTIKIDLKTGDTATASLSTAHYLTKENMVYPLAVEGAAVDLSLIHI